MAEGFSAGDVVMLKSGGPRMTVSEIKGEFATCQWFEESKPHMQQFRVAVLQKAATDEVLTSGEGGVMRKTRGY